MMDSENALAQMMQELLTLLVNMTAYWLLEPLFQEASAAEDGYAWIELWVLEHLMAFKALIKWLQICSETQQI